MTTPDDRAAYVRGLRMLADALEAHPGVELPADGTRLPMGWGLWGDDARERMAALARALPCAWRKGTREGIDDGPAYFDLAGELAGLRVNITAFRDAVCTRVVTGTEDREVTEVVRPAETRKVTKQVEVVTWDCGPLMTAGKA